MHYLKDAPYCEDTRVLGVGPEVKSGLPPICLIVAVQQSGSSSPSSVSSQYGASFK